jgi:tetratricopeptide (TPR) repeat protein
MPSTFNSYAQDAVIKEAREKLNDGKIIEAIEILEIAGKENPKNADIQYWLGVAYFKNGQTDSALIAGYRAYAVKPGHTLNRSLLLDIFIKKDDFLRAKNEAEFLVKEFPKDPSLKLKLAECLVGLNEFENASIELSKLEIQPNLPKNLQISVLLLLGEVYAMQKINETAAGYYQKTLMLDPNSVRAHLKLGKVFFREQKYNEALKEYLDALRLDSNSTEGNLNAGYIYFNGGKINPQQYGNAIFYLQKYIALEPNDFQGHLYIGKSFHALRSYRNAIEPLEKAVELDTSNGRFETLKLLAESYSGSGEHQKVILTYKNLLSRSVAMEGKDYARLGLSYRALRDTANTATYFGKAAETDSSLKGLYQDVGTMYYSGKYYSEAIKWFEKRVQFEPDDSSTSTAWQSLGLAQFYAARGKTDTLNALMSVRKAVQVKPYSIAHWLVLAQVSERVDSLELAKEAYRRVLADDSSNVQSYFGLASISFRQKKNEEAVKYFHKVMTLDEKNKLAPYYLAQCYLKLKKNSSAVPFLKKYLELDPKGPFASDSKNILKQLGVN